MRRPSAAPSTSSTWGPGPGVQGGHIVAQGTAAELAANPDSVTGRYLARPPARDHGPRRAIVGATYLAIKGARLHNLQGVDLRLPAGPAGLRHRGLGLRQVEPGAGGPGPQPAAKAGCRWPGPRGRAGRVPGLDWLAVPDPGPGGGPDPHRPDPALLPGDLCRPLGPDPAALCRHHGGAHPGLGGAALLLQHRRGALRGLRGPGGAAPGDELPAGREGPLRGLRRDPFQPRDPRGPFQGSGHRPGPEPERGRGRACLCRPPPGAPGIGPTPGGGVGLPQPGPAESHPVRGRGPAHQAGDGAVQGQHRGRRGHRSPHPLCPGRAHCGAAHGGRGAPDPGPASVGGRRSQRPGDRAQPRPHGRGGLAHRPGARGRRRRAGASWQRGHPRPSRPAAGDCLPLRRCGRIWAWPERPGPQRARVDKRSASTISHAWWMRRGRIRASPTCVIARLIHPTHFDRWASQAQPQPTRS